ncbi:MAG TPA: bifunctional nuclease domain-containing protein [archaeon]|nr:bifunctional nuclease domain-containing protein [archaeon]
MVSKKAGRYNAYVLVIAVIAIILSATSIVLNQFVQTSQPTSKQPTAAIANLQALSLDGFVKANIDVVETSLVVSSGCKGVIMTPTEQQIYSILIGLGNVTDFRPQTHDLIAELFENYNIELLQSKIEKEEDEIYYARLIVRQGDKILSLDSRPTDAIATALREGKDIYIKQEILDRKGKDICAKQ